MYIYTLLHIPTGVSYETALCWNKKSQVAGFLNKVKWESDGSLFLAEDRLINQPEYVYQLLYPLIKEYVVNTQHFSVAKLYMAIKVTRSEFGKGIK
jgi:hypothetical protein